MQDTDKQERKYKKTEKYWKQNKMKVPRKIVRKTKIDRIRSKKSENPTVSNQIING